MDLRPYQHEGALFLADDTGRPKARLLGDEPGLGKTRQAIHACDQLDARRILVLCYAVAKSHWHREFVDLQQTLRPVLTLSSQDTRIPDFRNLVIIANYDMIQRRDQPLRNKLCAPHRCWDVIILDEAHVLKSPDANRTKYVYGKRHDGRPPSLVSQATHVFLLTGTPMPNHAAELWTHFHALAPELIEDPLRSPHPLSYQHFLDRYAVVHATPWGNKIAGSKNLNDLNQRLRPFMLRRRKKDVLKDLPPLQFALYPLTLDAPPPSFQPQALEGYQQLDDEDFFHALSKPGAISTIRRVLGEAKAPAAVVLAGLELHDTPGSKIIMFAHHISVLNILERDLLALGFKPVRIDGSTSSANRDKAIHDFQNDPSTRVFLGQTQAAGTSITLTASSNVLIVEPSFVPKDNVQAASRAHRFGQANSVLARYLYVPDSLDERIIRILHRKTQAIATVLDDDIVNLGAPV